MSHAFPWLPFGMEVSGGAKVGRLVKDSTSFQVVQAQGGSEFILLSKTPGPFANEVEGLIPDASHFDRLGRINFGADDFITLITSEDDCPMCVGDIPQRSTLLSAKELLDLATAIGDLNVRSPDANWSEALYLQEFNIAIPVEENNAPENRDVLAISLLTGGVEDTSLSSSQIGAVNRWITKFEIEKFFNLLGIERHGAKRKPDSKVRSPDEFALAGRPELEEFFREYVIDHYWRKDKYDALGVKPPGGILLFGPPGSGKTYAVNQLADFMRWPVYDIDMGKVGSPYIHQTSVAIRKLFETAFENAPSMILIDEVDAFVGDRDLAGQDHKVEEISEFLRLIEAASERGIIVIATTNRKDAIDKAIKRRGRFDHLIEVGYPGAPEIMSVLEALLAERPYVAGLNLETISEKLKNRAMSDIAWIVNEAARIAVKSEKDQIDDICLMQAVGRLPSG